MIDDDDKLVLGQKKTEENNGTKKIEVEGPHPLPHVRKLLPLFPYRLKKKAKDGKFLKFISILKEISINIPLVEALEKMPGYAKFIKDLVTKKRTVSFEPIDNLHHCSAIATRSLVEKKEVPGTFTIPCTIGAFDFARGYNESANALQGVGSHSYAPKKLDLDLKNRRNPPVKPSIEEPPVLELKELVVHAWYFCDDPYLFRMCANNVIRRCIQEAEMLCILEACHSSQVGGHHSRSRTAQKILQCGYYCSTIYKDAHDLVNSYDQCQRQGNIYRCQELPIIPILEVELFDVWGIDFMVTFISSYRMKYILVEVDYVSKWVEAVALPDNESKSVSCFLRRNIFSRFGTPRAIISDGESHFCNKIFQTLLKKHGVRQHKVATPYHPQSSGNVEVSN
ncbi:uncharacterized protein LOC129884233 [Solanum dulcamara]|uniref:uncharacterized protein LOC129884233 n=1 Tax=Solanum dulcamara TaxID=45834 RepID=UPI002485EBB7|nr:uncharacterized protein LOC129884233 [Solanum dulcamara]